MTVVVGYLAGKSGNAPLHLAVEAAQTLRTSLCVATIVPKPWTVPSPARVDAEYAAWADQLAADSAREAERELAAIPHDVEVSFHSHAHRSVSGGLVDVVAETDAELLVLGSSASGALGQVVVGSTADYLLHSCPIPLAIAPRGYRGARTGALTRITCGYPGTPESIGAVRQIADLAERLRIPLRVITFAVRGRTMYPPEVGLHAEDSILAAWVEQAQALLEELRTDGVLGPDVDLAVVSGNGWDQALDDADWIDGEILALGSSPRGDIARVFLGSRGAKILRHSPVPVLVVPA
ncbi:MAG: universal stress protein [Mycobacterium sp.]|nr:universal stress protein [Mycobacterium sp.]